MSYRRTPDPQAGRSAQRRGLDAQRRLAAWLRDTGLYPTADHVGTFPGAANHGDIIHIGDRIAEVTVQPWTELQAKMRQAEHDARACGVDEWFVWKPSKGRPAGESVVVWRADVIWPLLARLDGLEAERGELLAERDEALARADEAYHRGYEAASVGHAKLMGAV